jgi:hypothetical protein
LFKVVGGRERERGRERGREGGVCQELLPAMKNTQEVLSRFDATQFLFGLPDF